MHWGCTELTHEAPVLESEALLQRVEGQVAARALGVVVRAGELLAGRLEAATGNGGRGRGGAESCAGEHLGGSAEGVIGRAGGLAGVPWVGWGVERGWACFVSFEALRSDDMSSGRV